MSLITNEIYKAKKMSKVDFESQREIWLYLATGGKIKEKDGEIEYAFTEDGEINYISETATFAISATFRNFHRYKKVLELDKHLSQ